MHKSLSGHSLRASGERSSFRPDLYDPSQTAKAKKSFGRPSHPNLLRKSEGRLHDSLGECEAATSRKDSTVLFLVDEVFVL
jgi:hypothetical protein